MDSNRGMSIEDTIARDFERIKEENRNKISSKKIKSSRRPGSIRNITSIAGNVDIDSLLIESSSTEVEETFLDVIESIPFDIDSDDVVIYMFIHLNSKQGPVVQVAGIRLFMGMDPEDVYQLYQEAVMELENRYIGGEEYNEAQLILSRIVRTQFQVQTF